MDDQSTSKDEIAKIREAVVGDAPVNEERKQHSKEVIIDMKSAESMKGGDTGAGKNENMKKEVTNQKNDVKRGGSGSASGSSGADGSILSSVDKKRKRIVERYTTSKVDKELQHLASEGRKIDKVAFLTEEEKRRLRNVGITTVNVLASSSKKELVEAGIPKERAEEIVGLAREEEKRIEERIKSLQEEKRKKEFDKRMEIARRYAAKLIQKYRKRIKSVVVYGSTVKGTYHEKSDLDIFVIMDDTEVEEEIPDHVKDQIWDELVRIARDLDERITIQAFMFLTEFWENLRVAEPVLISILRYGVPVYDVGVFMPAKRMVQRGMVPTTKEAVDKKISAAPRFVEYAISRVKSAAHYLEQAVASAGNAALMMIGRLPVNKEEVADALEATLVARGMLDKSVAEDIRSVHRFAKDVEYMSPEEAKDIGRMVDEYVEKAKRVIEAIKVLIDSMGMRQKGNILIETYKMFLKADVVALRRLGIEPPEELKDLPTVMHRTFPEVKEQHETLFNTMMKYLEMVKEGKEEEIPEEKIYEIREKTREFVEQLQRVLEKRLKETKGNAPSGHDTLKGGKKQERETSESSRPDISYLGRGINSGER